MKRFAELSEQEILALAISSEDEDSRIYRGFAEGLREPFPASAKVFDEMADEEIRHRDHAARHVPRQVRRIPAADPPPGRQRLHPAQQPLWLMRPLGLDEVRKFAEHDGIRGRALLPQGGRSRARHLGPQAAHRARRGRGQARGPGAQARRNHPDQGRPRQGGRDRTPHVRAAIRAAGPRRPDGRLGVDAGAAVRRRLRHPQHLGDLPGRPRGFGRRRHLDGVRRGAVRRRLADRPRHAVDPRQHHRR